MNEEKHTTGFFNSVSELAKKFSSAEKMIFSVFAALLVVSGLSLLVQVNNLFLVEVPAKGGVMKEGIIGSPRFINPVLAISDTDKSLSELVYSGLLKQSADGSFVPDLAESYRVSDDGLVYDLTLKNKIYFHDGKPVTADDVLFTIEKIVDPVIKSPRASSFEGVMVEKISENLIRFTLKKPYSPFLSDLTIGILPKHVWQEVTSEEFPFSDKNINPIGSGAYKISSVDKNGSGIPLQIILRPFSKYAAGSPKIGEIDVSFFGVESDAFEAYKGGLVNSVGGLAPQTAIELQNNTPTTLVSSIMPRIFGVFFNQNQATLFSNIEVRKALDVSVDKAALTEEITHGFGIPLGGPTPLDVWVDSAPATTTSTTTSARIEYAKNILTKAGWKLNKDGVLEKKTSKETLVLKFSISTSDVPDLKRTGEILRDTWNQLGAQVDLKVFEAGDLNQNVIRPRKYDALLFGEVVGKEMDLYPFWHSSERNDPGLNISLYTSIKADKLLEEARGAATQEETGEKLTEFKDEIKKDVPAIFLYAPKYIYGVTPSIKNVRLGELGNPSDRFASIEDWYIKTAKVWKIFAN